MPSRILRLGILFLAFSSSRAWGAELAKVTVPDSAVVDGKTLVLNGLGLRKKTVFAVKVYVAALYLNTPCQDDKQILKSEDAKQLEIHFVRNVSAKDISNSWDEGLEKNCKAHCEAFQERLEKLKGLSRDLQKGSVVRFIFRKDSMEMKLGDLPTETFQGRDFANLILSNFVGDPPSEEVKKGLLGLGEPSFKRTPASYTAP